MADTGPGPEHRQDGDGERPAQGDRGADPTPRVSIGLPVLDGADTLRHALDSFLGQTFGDLEIVISDNASTDATPGICAEYAQRDPRVRYHRNPENLGARANYNRVFELARGELFKWAGHDDWVAPGYLERCVEAFAETPEAVACYTGMCRVDAEEGTKRKIVLPPASLATSERALRRFHDVLWHLPYHPIFGLFRREELARTDLIPNVPEPDRVTLAQMALRGPFVQVDEVLLFQRSPVAGRDVWTWLDPANAQRPKRRPVRVSRALVRSALGHAQAGPVERAAMSVDAVASVLLRSIPGKIRQYQRRFHIGYADGPTLNDLGALASGETPAPRARDGQATGEA